MSSFLDSLPTIENVETFVVIGLAFGSVIALSGVGMVVLYRATGVLNLAFGAIGALGALITWQLVNYTSIPHGIAYAICIIFGAVVTLAYGVVFGPLLARRDPLVKAIGTLGLALIFLGIMQMQWGQRSGISLPLGTTDSNYDLGKFGRINWTMIIGMIFCVVLTGGTTLFLRVTKLGTAMRALANDREITATLGVPVRRVEAAAWLGSGIVCGSVGLLLSNLLALDILTLTFFVIYAVSAALVATLRSLWGTLFAALGIGLVYALLNAFYDKPGASVGWQPLADYREMTPFVIAIAALLWFGRKRVVSVSRVAR